MLPILFRDLDNLRKSIFDDVRDLFMIQHPKGGFLSPSIFSIDEIFNDRSKIEERDDKLILNVDLPGFEKEDIEVTIKDDILKIEAKNHNEDKKREYSRIITLPSKVETENIDGFYKNGVLTLEIPKIKELDGKKIEIK
jgi:HSP20 family protein